MAASNELKKLDELLEIVRKIEKDASVEFAKTNNTLEQIKEDQTELRKDIEKLFNIIQEPKDGIYKKINDIVHDLESLAEDQTECSESLHEVSEKVNEIHVIKENLVKIAGDRLEILDSTIKTSQNSKKILWTFILAAISLAGEKIVEILHFF